MAVCYILYSKKLNQYYIGITTGEISERINKHNFHLYGTNKYTVKTDDWEEFLVINCIDNNQAVRLERHIKRMKSKTYIQNLKKYPEMIEKLLKKM